jgi:hypothetical protein
VNNSRVSFRATNGQTTTLQGTILIEPDGTTRWTARSIKAGVEWLRPTAGSGNAITPEQVAVLVKYMAELPRPPIVTNDGKFGFQELPIQSMNIYLGGPGRTSVTRFFVRNTQMYVLPDGRVAPASLFANGMDADGNPLPPPPPNFRPAIPGSLAAIRLMPYEAGV